MKKILFISLLCISAFIGNSQLVLKINRFLVDSAVGGVSRLWLDTSYNPVGQGYWKDVGAGTGGSGGEITLAGQNYLSLAGSVLTANAVNLSGGNVTGTLAAARFPALTGVIQTTAGSLTTSFVAGSIVNADVNTNAAIAATKIHDGTVTNTEFGWLNYTDFNNQRSVWGEGATPTSSPYTSGGFGGMPTLFGYQTNGNGAAFGYKAQATNYEATAIGPQAQANCLACIAIGDGAIAEAHTWAGNGIIPPGIYGNINISGDAAYGRGNINFFNGQGAGIDTNFVACYGCVGSSTTYDLSVATREHQLYLGWYQHNSDYFSGGDGLYNEVFLGGPEVASAPHDIDLYITSELGSDQSGVDFRINASRATGNAVGGSAIFQTSTAGSSGSTLQTLTESFKIAPDGIYIAPLAGNGSGYASIDNDGKIGFSSGVGSAPSVVVDDATTLAMTNTGGFVKTYIYSGADTATWTLPAVGTTGQLIKVKNRGTGLLIVEADGTDSIWANYILTSLPLTQGSAQDFQDDGGYWATLSIVYEDTSPPQINSMTAVDANTIVVVFDQEVVATTAGWSFDNGSALTINGVSGAGTTWSFDINETMLGSDDITASYDAATGNTVDLNDNELHSFTDDMVANDISGELSGGIQPTLHDGAAYVVDAPTETVGISKSLDFDGTNDYASFTEITLNENSSSISLWFKADAFGDMIFSSSTNANSYCRILNSTTVRFQGITPGEFKDYTFSTMSTGTWYNLILVRESTFVRAYLDGVQAAETGGQEVLSPMIFDQFGKYWDGSSGFWYNGKLSNVRVYSDILDGADITSLSTGGDGSKTPIALFYLNDNP